MLHKLNNILESHGLRKTGFRQDVLRIFMRSPRIALSQAQIEETLGKHDRITLYRTLKSFEEKGVIHKAMDGTDASKYALCDEACDMHSHTDDHPHFLCESCGLTYCLDELKIPEFNLPAKYKLTEVQLALHGICDVCNKS